ncbi:sulfite exporter TauE/SafE family protein [Sessilibacter corallicola]|uniref:Probable membrane transporter protein n=1 Tax=Sessilibacter corallicola TaxID=2904075 RepID=A0ABQ0A4Y5_9GAMM
MLSRLLSSHYSVWIGFVLCFYVIWIFYVLYSGYYQELGNYWQISLTMAFGSYVAGSTPMGGGAVGFPVLVLGLDMPVSLGRDFSLLIQSLGMTSASIFILVSRQKIAVNVLIGVMLGVAIGIPLGLFWVEPNISELLVKLIFAVLCASFGILHMVRLDEFSTYSGILKFSTRLELIIGGLVGFIASSGIVSITGVGVDMVLYCILVLVFKSDLRVAIPTSVIAMALTSLYSVLIKSVTVGFHEDVFENWLAAAPIVVVGAPLGAFLVNILGRKKTLSFVSLLCVSQLFWTCSNEFSYLGFGGVLATLCTVFIVAVFFETIRLVSQGNRLQNAN